MGRPSTSTVATHRARRLLDLTRGELRLGLGHDRVDVGVGHLGRGHHRDRGPDGAELSVPAMMRRSTPSAGALERPGDLVGLDLGQLGARLTSVPSSTSHSVILPEVIDRPHLGMVTLAILASAMAAFSASSRRWPWPR